ncbi:folylpolyglutamate synthase/dihydrofolate synthase family protein [Enterococcus sp. S86.2]|uniref:bifunctional folylpolyglutamate synthase/dihydrofolate synthase n=1 Tax=Enterococcus sp. S86.2 TaxID=3031299 RepID=UPI0026EC6CEC|nr:folylpolyglutamate synthase/dihydrofolate synthase family protein [Enterococcus sp. S86.2]
MFETGEEAIEWIHSRKKFGSRPGLIRIKKLLNLSGNPEKNVIGIHIAGTNGKGSTVTYLRCLLETQDIKVGTFTSPYIESFYERISINGQAISADDFVKLANKFRPYIKQMDGCPSYQGITEFEILTAMAFDYFKERVDVAIFEVGIGGLMDSTNVFTPILTAITTIGLDHTDILGETEEAIAKQKAGIIKRGVPIVTGNIASGPLQVIYQTSLRQKADLFRQGKSYQVQYVSSDNLHGENFHFQNEDYYFTNLRVPLLGKYQVENAAVAIQLFLLYCQQQGRFVNKKTIIKGLDHALWPGRMERISTTPNIIIDGAHNPHAVKQFVKTVNEEFQYGKKYILFSALTTKNIKEMLNEIQSISQAELALTTFAYPNALKMGSSFNHGDKQITYYPDWQRAIQEIITKMTPADTLFITGSLYFVAQVRDFFKNKQLEQAVYS